MKSHQLLSDKDLQTLKVSYRSVIENYYENPSEDHIAEIILLNSLAMQTISTREQSDALLLVSMLEVLRVKAKGSKELSESINSTIVHMKNPLKVYLRDDTIQEGLERISIYPLCCVIVSRFYEQEMKPKGDAYNWREIIAKVSKNSDKNMGIALETLVTLLPNFPAHSKEVSKSGMVKYICSVYLPQVLSDKNSLYRSLKVLKMVAHNDRTLLPGREKNIALVIYTHPAYILIVQELAEACLQSEYSNKVLSNPKDIDPLYVWSYNSKFSNLATQRSVDELEQILKDQGKGITQELEWKVYAVLNNLIRARSLKLGTGWRLPVHAEKNLNAYLQMAVTAVERGPNQFYNNVDIKTIETVYDKCKTTDPVTNKLIKQLKALDPAAGPKKIGKLESSVFQQFSVQKNPEILMEKASKVPRNAEDLNLSNQILNLNSRAKDEFEADTIKTLKNKGIQSLKRAMLVNHQLPFFHIFNSLNPEINDPETINKLLKLTELYLTMDPEAADKLDPNRFLQLLEWLENNHGLHIVDWVAASQVLSILFGPDEWKTKLEQIPKRSFWVLNAVSCDKNEELIAKINSVPVSHVKGSLLIGFIAKTGDEELKRLILKTKLLDYVIESVCSYKNPRQTAKSFVSRPEDDISDGEEMKRYLNNVLNLSYLIFNWSKISLGKQLESKIIRPCLQNIFRCFHGTEHEFKFLENSLPFKLNVSQLKDINVSKLLQTHGRLTSYLHNNKFPGRLDFSKISSLHLETDPDKVSQILKFLDENPQMIESRDLLAVLDELARNTKREKKYWRYFPHYISLLRNIITVATRSTNPEIIAKLTDILESIIAGTAENEDITADEMGELYEGIYDGLTYLMGKKIKLDAKRLRREAEKIKDDEWQIKIMQKLKQMDEMVVPTKVTLATETLTIQQHTSNKYQSIPVNNLLVPPSRATNISTLSSVLEPPRLSASNLQINLNLDADEKKDENMLQGVIDTNDMIKKEELPTQSPQEQKLLDALKMLKKIIRKQQPKQLFPKLVEIFLVSDFNKNRRYVLGHLLTEYYELIDRDQAAIALLQMKDKTNLTKEVCLNFLRKFQQAFVISRRWKLMGYEFMDLAMERINCNNSNKVQCIANGCEIVEYNLVKTPDISYFQGRKYHQQILALFPRVQQKQQAIYYLLLVGSSSRLQQVKAYYINNKLHCSLTEYASKQAWMSDSKVVANYSYALSSLVYTQNHIALDVTSRRAEMLRLMGAYSEFCTVKPVVEAGCSLLSNLCYSNKEAKEMLHGYGIVGLLLEIMTRNLKGAPEVSTFKQIMRTLGNISLHRPSAEKLIDGKVCHMVVEMIEHFNILIYRDDEKLKVLKLTVDFISNLATHKYNLELMHSEGLTNFVITILETTEISEDQIIMACIDTIDGLCQSQQIENYVVMDKKLLLQLIDLLKIKEDQRLITKSIRLLTNMTLNQVCIPYILQANLLSVLANIVLPVYKNQKIELYINKIILRIFSKKPDVKLVLKSGYLDCLMKAIENSEQIDDGYIDILLHYCQYIPNYLNHRAFFNLVKMLTNKQNQKEVVEKCLKVIRVIFSSEEREEDDILISGCCSMYEKLLLNGQANKMDVIYLIGIHCTKSKKFKRELLQDHVSKKGNLIDYIEKMTQDEATKEQAMCILFAIFNKDKSIVDIGQEIVKEQDFAYKLLSKGLQCKLYRTDGSFKNAIVDINEMYIIRAYKYPDGEIKKKYMISIRQLRDWQFDFQADDPVFQLSVFSKEKSLFAEKTKIENCVSLLGSQHWGQFVNINLEFNDSMTKMQFVKAISALLMTFKS